ncbi:MAG TPA: hypothetical protein DEA08_01485 [Planctomycetes bacterium]|nr:hypothetical protein [Planctomycetota bacterium]
MDLKFLASSGLGGAPHGKYLGFGGLESETDRFCGRGGLSGELRERAHVDSERSDWLSARALASPSR